MKLVRDLIPAIILESGKKCQWRKVHGRDEHMALLKLKMIEELNEFMETPNYEEACDMYEVFCEILKLRKLQLDQVVDTASRKRFLRGGFTNGVVLEGVDEG